MERILEYFEQCKKDLNIPEQLITWVSELIAWGYDRTISPDEIHAYIQLKIEQENNYGTN